MESKARSRTWAEVDLDSIRHNVRNLKQKAPNSRLMAVVKADAYGHGSLPVARAAVEAGADTLAVVTAEEGIELRQGEIAVPILIFTDLSPQSLRLAAQHDLAITAHSLESAKRILSHPQLQVHLKVNTGMNRWGVEPYEVEEALGIIGDRLAGVYTHFACADSDAKATGQQIEKFGEVLDGHSFDGVMVHAANSAATLWHPRSHYDCVRPGVAIYGLHPAGDSGDPREEDLLPAMSLKSYVAGVRKLEPCDGVSYGMTFRATGPMFAATVPVGYAEGYRRALSGKAEALIRNRRRPILGRVTMDACVFGVDGNVEVGDEVVLIGEQGGEWIRAEEAGRWAGTINYEITTGVNPRRVERRYVDVQGP